MSRPVRWMSTLLLAAALAVPAASRAWERGDVERFATLPDGAAAPEGLEVGADGTVYASGFGAPSGAGEIYVFERNGKFQRTLRVAGASPSLLGLAFQPGTRNLLVADFGASKVLSVNPDTGASTVFMTLPALPRPELGSSLNDITFDKAGNVYVSDSFQGIVWTTTSSGGVAKVWVEDALLRTSGVPPFGANGLRFNKAETALFVANTGNDTVVQVPSAGGVAGTPSVFANSVNGADGLIIDGSDNVWVAANQADEIVVMDPTGKAIAKLGDFGGAIDRDGAAIGFLFPASLRFAGNFLLVTNLALDLRTFSPTFITPDSAWAAQVTRHTLSKIRAKVP